MEYKWYRYITSNLSAGTFLFVVRCVLSQIPLRECCMHLTTSGYVFSMSSTGLRRSIRSIQKDTPDDIFYLRPTTRLCRHFLSSR